MSKISFRYKSTKIIKRSYVNVRLTTNLSKICSVSQASSSTRRLLDSPCCFSEDYITGLRGFCVEVGSLHYVSSAKYELESGKH